MGVFVICVGVFMCGFCNVEVCVCMGFVKCGCVCVCMAFVMCVCVCVRVLVICVGVLMCGCFGIMCGCVYLWIL